MSTALGLLLVVLLATLIFLGVDLLRRDRR